MLCRLLLVALFATDAHAARVVVTVPASTPPTDAIYLAGSSPAVGSWKADGLKLARQSDGTFAGDVDGPLAFKITRGSWATVEKAADGGEIGNRAIDANAAEVHVTVARWSEAAPTTRASTVVGDLRIEQIAGRTIRVWLPPGYAVGDARYPVLYLHDGQNCFDAATSAFGVEWQVDESLTRLIEAKSIPPLIVVGIDNAGERRIDEYTPTPDKGRGGAGEAYERFVVDEVKRHVDGTYRTKPGRADTFVGGSSLGGLISLDMLRRHREVFGGAVVLSPSLWWDDESLTAALERAPLAADARVAVTMGAREGADAAGRGRYVAHAERLGRALKAIGVRHALTIDAAGEHNEAAWARQFPEALQLLFIP